MAPAIGQPYGPALSASPMGLAIFHYFGLGKESPPQALGYSEQLFTCHEKVFWAVIFWVGFS